MKTKWTFQIQHNSCITWIRNPTDSRKSVGYFQADWVGCGASKKKSMWNLKLVLLTPYKSNAMMLLFLLLFFLALVAIFIMLIFVSVCLVGCKKNRAFTGDHIWSSESCYDIFWYSFPISRLSLNRVYIGHLGREFAKYSYWHVIYQN